MFGAILGSAGAIGSDMLPNSMCDQQSRPSVDFCALCETTQRMVPCISQADVPEPSRPLAYSSGPTIRSQQAQCQLKNTKTKTAKNRLPGLSPLEQEVFRVPIFQSSPHHVHTLQTNKHSQGCPSLRLCNHPLAVLPSLAPGHHHTAFVQFAHTGARPIMLFVIS